jgi:hypothetical protein
VYRAQVSKSTGLGFGLNFWDVGVRVSGSGFGIKGFGFGA